MLEIVGANINRKEEAIKPRIIEKNIHVLTAFNALAKLLFSSSSETMQVQARPIPEEAKVIANKAQLSCKKRAGYTSHNKRSSC